MRIPYKNRTEFAGFVGNDPELRHTGSGVPVLELRVCAQFSWRDESGARLTHDEWATVVFYRGLAEDVAARGVGKGTFVHVEGRRQSRSLAAPAGGKPRKVNEIIATQWHVVDLPPAPGAATERQAQDPDSPAVATRIGRERTAGPSFGSSTADLA